VRPVAQQDPYVLEISKRLDALARFIAPLKAKVPPIELVREVRDVLRDRRRRGALEECLVVIGVEISPLSRADIRKQLHEVESWASCVLSALEHALEDCPPISPDQEKRFARRAKRKPDRVYWLKDADDRVREAGFPHELGNLIVDDLPRLRRASTRASFNLRYIARKLRGQLDEREPDMDFQFEEPAAKKILPTELGIDRNGDTRVLTLTQTGSKPVCLRYPNGKGREDLVRRDTGPGRILVAAALGHVTKAASRDAWRRARRALRHSSDARIDLRGTPECPEFSCTVVASKVLTELEAQR
jgi:hypothetical protein